MARRGAGEGSVFRRSDGRWVAHAPTTLGRRKVLYARTRPEVVAKLAEALKATRDGLPLPSGLETVGAFLARWLEGQHHRIRPMTWVRYEQYIRLHALPALGRVRLGKLTPMHLEQLYSNRLKSGQSTTSVHHLHAVLHRALSHAVRGGLVARNVADLVDPPRPRHREMTVMSTEQVRELLAASAGGPSEALLTVAITTGMRQGELLALRWRDVDLVRRVISVRGTLHRFQGRWSISEPKTPRSRRQVELSSTAVEALRRHRSAQAEIRLLNGPSWNELDLVFPAYTGLPQNPKSVNDRFHALLERCGLPRVRFHDLRHTAATLMLVRGVHPKVVSEMLGHTTIGITLDLYSHVTPTMQQEAARAMDALLGD